MKKNLNSDIESYVKNTNDEIDLRQLYSFVLRNKILIGTIASFSFLIACLYSLTLKRVWEGQFQIVLNPPEDSKVINFNPALNNLLAPRRSSNLKTQVGILQSPSVLMPIYNFVNVEGNDSRTIKELPFSKWKKNLDIELERGTSILNIAYRDSNKEIILPALKKMSLIYQDYSESSVKRSQALTRKYLIGQINLFKEKSKNSIKAAQNFAIDQNLIYLLNENNNLIKENANVVSRGKMIDFQPAFGPIVDIENVRVGAANKINLINLQIKKINELDPLDYENLQYFGSSIPALQKEGLPQTLKDIEERLVVLRSKFTENDRSIVRLLEQRKLTVDLLKSRAIKYLKVAKLEAEATMESAMRPKGVLLKYKELIREAARDESTLVLLENDLRKLQLEQARISEPWKLITQPTLLNSPVAPSKKKIGLIGLILGLIIGGLVALFREKKTDKIFSLPELEKILSKSCLERINKKDDFKEMNQIMFLKEFLKNQAVKKIAFITLEEINETYLQKLINFLTNETDLNTEIDLISSQNSLENFKSAEFTILFTSLDNSSYSEIKTLNNKLNLLKIVLNEFIILD